MPNVRRLEWLLPTLLKINDYTISHETEFVDCAFLVYPPTVAGLSYIIIVSIQKLL